MGTLMVACLSLSRGSYGAWQGPPHVMHQMAGRTFPMLLVMRETIRRLLREGCATRPIVNPDAMQVMEQQDEVDVIIERQQQVDDIDPLHDLERAGGLEILASRLSG
jgi:hypothetical protein